MRQANTVHHYRIPAVLALITVAVMLAFAAAMTVSAQSNDPDWRQAPTGLSVTTGNEAGKLDINWDTSSQDTKTLSDYRVTWKPDGEAFKHWGDTDWNAFPSTNELTLTDLNAGATYKVKVRARYDDNKKSRWSAVVTAQSGITPNTAATGQPIINGTAHVRQTLTAGTSSIADDNGLTNATFSHQWLRNSDDTNTDISGATDETYVLSNADLEHSIKVRVSFTDDNGYKETVTSKASAVVVVPPNVAPAGLPTITGTAEEGETLNADTSGIADGNGLTNVSFRHQWVRSADETDTDIPDATGSTHIVTSADAGSAISVRASFTDDDGYLETVTSKASASVPENTSKQPPVIVPPEEPQSARATGNETPEDATILGTLNYGATTKYNQTLNPPSDSVNYYEFTLTIQKDVQISVLNQETDDAVLQLVDSDGYTQKEANSVGAGTDRIMWTILGPGTHYIKISQTATVYNVFDLKVRVKTSPLVNDDYSGDILTRGTITLGDYAEGTIAGSSQRDDNDWFVVELPVLSTYEFKATPTGPSPSRSLFVILRDSHGQAINSGSRVHHKTQQMGKHFVEVRGSNGGYLVSVSVFHRDSVTISEPENEDLPADIGTTGYIQINGAPATGYLRPQEADQFAVRLQAGETYQFDLHQKEASLSPSLNRQETFLLGRSSEALFPTQTDVTKISGAADQERFGIGDTNSGEGNNSRFRAAIHRSGIYFVRTTNSYTDSQGAYSLYVTDITPDYDPPPRRGSKPTRSEGSSQDLPNFINSAGYVQVNGNGATGNINSADDQDVFKVQLEARTAYQIEVWGENGIDDGGTLADPEVRLRNRLFDNLTNATFVEQTNTSTAKQSAYGGISDADGGLGQNSLIPIAVYQTGTYYIQVGSEGTETGTYTVSVKEISWEPRVRPGYTRPGLPPGSSYAATSSEGIDDLTQDTATKGNVEPIGTRAHGRIDTNRDVDYFKIVLANDYSYRIEVKGDEPAAPGGTLSDPQVELMDSSGNRIGVPSNNIAVNVGDSSDENRIADDDSGEGENATLEIWTRYTGTYYIKVSGFGGGVGTYTVQATVLHRGGFTN